MMRRRRKSRGGEGEGGRGGGEEGGGCSHIVMVQTIPELIAYPCLLNYTKYSNTILLIMHNVTVDR